MAADELTIFLCGDVMPGRGIDQVLPHPCPPQLFEPAVKSAREYVTLAEAAHGAIPRPVAWDYVWGDALAELARVRPSFRLINLETAITTSEDAVLKGINYRMHPANIPVLAAADVDVCVLANNHVLDWGGRGLLETLAVLERAGVQVAGAGRDRSAAQAPVACPLGEGRRLLVFACGTPDSGIPPDWAATAERPGVHLLADYTAAEAARLAQLIEREQRPGDVVILSIHWGGNWGFEIPPAQRRFVQALLERAPVALVHGHSSHHARGIEVQRGCPVLYGCGDFINDYEGIEGYEQYRGDLVLMYLVTFALDTGRAVRLELVPLQLRNFRLHHVSETDRAWLLRVLGRECRRLGTRLTAADGPSLLLEWD